MHRPTQLSFKRARTFEKHFRTEHGGSLYKGRRKEALPLSTKRPLHVVLRSSRARGAWSLLHARNKERVAKLVRTTAQSFEVKLTQVANSGNHLHLIIQGKTKQGLQNF